MPRPTKYRKEFIEELISYCDKPLYDEVELPHYDKDGNIKWVDKKRFPTDLPTLVGFAKHINIALSTLYDWIDPESKRYKKKFSEIAMRVFKESQKDFLNQASLQGYYNPQYAKFVAVNTTDMKDVKSLVGDDDAPLTIKVVYDEPAETGS